MLGNGNQALINKNILKDVISIYNMIKVLNYNKEKQKLELVTDMPVNLANAIRRSALEIPVMAIDDVTFVKNDSALYDEIIAHRLGLIPIKTEKSLKEIKFKLVAKGPETVYSIDISPSVETPYKVPIVILDNEQELEVVAEARTGKGIDHIKYSPGLVYFRHNLEPEILDYIIIDEEGKVSYDLEELETKGLPQDQINKIKKANSVNEIIFAIESWGQIDAKEIFTRSIEVLDKNLQELSKIIK